MASGFSAAAAWANSAGGQLRSSGRKSVCASPIALSSPSGSWSMARTIHGSLRSSAPKYCAKPSRSTCPVSSCSAKLSERPCANSLFETFQTRTESKCAGNRSSTSELNFTPKAMTSPQTTSNASAKACTRPGRRARKRASFWPEIMNGGPAARSASKHYRHPERSGGFAQRSRRTSRYSVGGGGAERISSSASAHEKLEVLRLRSRPPAPAGNSAPDDGG